MQQECGRRRRVPEVAVATENHADVANTGRQVRVAEIVRASLAQRFAGERENIEYGLPLVFLNLGLEIADG